MLVATIGDLVAGRADPLCLAPRRGCRAELVAKGAGPGLVVQLCSSRVRLDSSSTTVLPE